jgi:hypothetical protein
VRQMRVQPFKARIETLKKSASESVRPPEGSRDNCRASEFRLAQELGLQQPPGRIQIGWEEGFEFAFASLNGLLHGPKPLLDRRSGEL